MPSKKDIRSLSDGELGKLLSLTLPGTLGKALAEKELQRRNFKSFPNRIRSFPQLFSFLLRLLRLPLAFAGWLVSPSRPDSSS